MKNLKFRAWDKRRKDFRNDIFVDTNENLYQFSKNTGYGQAITYLDNKHIVLMQSTGLFDKYGKEIFDGDIVSKENEYVVIKSFTGLWKAVSQKDDEKDRELYFLTLADVCEDIEVIGNIYENRELLG